MNEKIKEVLERTPFEPELKEEILKSGRLKKAKAGQTVITPDDEAQEMPLVMSGLLRVMRNDDNGNEVFLYYLEGGETCAMSITCCLEGKRSSFHVVAEEDSELWMMPVSNLDNWITKYSSFRRFVFNSYQTRFDELLHTIDSMVFMNLDERLYNYLLDKKIASGSFEIKKTHQQIANELNTSRVVISRLLKKLEKEDKIEQRRNYIEIL
ncbi:cyclic nucleotide-binding protein [Marivirga tractuosa]|uniref:Transcriptional regulator, Crp/Fnr family n=1 Tax=Marivirga tractuosa (strain ATCC 23168 / DSM 4126 / NBRC 15989 / NCIMB 1408 / VKM B-1430 / H-43) TaxID=643867 RepID=E4TUI9_MARTH|nr:Crp/Fnr family transcriptional regulator [Marivirga tractuosa]ADR23082.1 transcriptional regulator, Crp/Fnr family [Marivirga tractuosa DSM 4126]BDD16244.1 cyclic nucleotide-binding protein [Marivirga tractuosa]